METACRHQKIRHFTLKRTFEISCHGVVGHFSGSMEALETLIALMISDLV
jgi:hypothetical protein